MLGHTWAVIPLSAHFWMYCGQALESVADNSLPECFYLYEQNVFEKNSSKLQENKRRQNFNILHHYYTRISNQNTFFSSFLQ